MRDCAGAPGNRWACINDEHGHLTGDRVLVAVAGKLRLARREQDVLVRWGGEEFIWLCLDADAAEGPALCERLRVQLRTVDVVGDDGERVSITASLGFVPLPVWAGVDTHWELALRIADSAVYRSKDAGRNRWAGFRGLTPPPANADDDALQVPVLERAGHLGRVEMGA